MQTGQAVPPLPSPPRAKSVPVPRHEKMRGHADTVRVNILELRKFHAFNNEFEAKSSKRKLLLHIISNNLHKYHQICCLNQTNRDFCGKSTVQIAEISETLKVRPRKEFTLFHVC